MKLSKEHAYRAKVAHEAGKRTVTLQGVKFRMRLSENRQNIIVTPADGSLVPMANIPR